MALVNRFRQSNWLIFIVPILIACLSINLKIAHGPFFLAKNSDPEYQYLLNALLITQGDAPTHIDHPGTTLQVFIALVLEFRFFVFNENMSHVLLDPELYLDVVYYLLMTIFVAVNICTGFLIRRLGLSFLWLLLIQATPLMSITILQSLSRVRPEFLLIILTQLFVVVVLYWVCEKVNKIYHLLYFSLMAGFGVATKVTFLPLIIIPFFFFDGRFKIYYVLLAGLFFFTCILPILPNVNAFFEWIYNIALHSGGYGSGAPNFISFSFAKWAIKNIIFNEPVYVFFLTFYLLSIFYLFKKSKKGFMEFFTSANVLFATVTLLAIVVNLILVIKHYGPHYLTPSLMLTSLMFYLLHRAGTNASGTSIRFRFFFGMFFLSMLFLSGFNYLSLRNRFIFDSKQAQMITQERIDKYPDYLYMYYHRSSSVEYSLKMGNDFSSSYFTRKLNSLYPNCMFYDVFNQRVTDFGCNKINKQLINNKKVLLQGPSFRLGGGIYESPIKIGVLKMVYQGDFESLYFGNEIEFE